MTLTDYLNAYYHTKFGLASGTPAGIAMALKDAMGQDLTLASDARAKVTELQPVVNSGRECIIEKTHLECLNAALS